MVIGKRDRSTFRADREATDSGGRFLDPKALSSSSTAMKLRELYVRDLARSYEEATGERLSPEEASEMARRLLILYLRLAEPLPGSPASAPPSEAVEEGSSDRPSAPTNQASP
jgi:hypothetical protein